MMPGNLLHPRLSHKTYFLYPKHKVNFESYRTEYKLSSTQESARMLFGPGCKIKFSLTLWLLQPKLVSIPNRCGTHNVSWYSVTERKTLLTMSR